VLNGEYIKFSYWHFFFLLGICEEGWSGGEEKGKEEGIVSARCSIVDSGDI
jgi:hypothetical protein